MNVVQQLNQLQEIDLDLEANEGSLQQIIRQIGENGVVVKAQNKLASERQHLEELQHQQRTTEWQIDDLSEKITPAEEKLYSGRITNTKELASLQHEVEGFKAHRGQLEDKVLEIMEQVEPADAGVATTSEELKKIETEWQRQQQQLSADKERVKAIISDLKDKRLALSDKIDPQTVALYQQLRKQKVTAVVRAEQGICGGCRISLSTANLQQVRSGKLVQCNNCGRIMYLALSH